MTTQHTIGDFGPFTGTITAIQSRSAHEILDDVHQLFTAINDLVALNCSEDLNDQYEQLRDEIIEYLGNPQNN